MRNRKYGNASRLAVDMIFDLELIVENLQQLSNEKGYATVGS